VAEKPKDGTGKNPPADDLFDDVHLLYEKKYTEQMLNLERRTLVIANSNAEGSEELANYYASKRGIPGTQICLVKLPAGILASMSQLRSARKTIIKDCLCPLISDADRPAPCDATNYKGVAQMTKITHLALMRGVPSRLYDTGWSADKEGPTLEYYLSIGLFADPDVVLAASGLGYTANRTMKSDYELSNRYADPIPNLPSESGVLAVGRIDGISLDSAKQTIDRTIDAENEGIFGNFYAQGDYNLRNSSPSVANPAKFPVATQLQSALWAFTGSVQPLCKEYTSSQYWNFSVCKSFFTPGGGVPGVAETQVPDAAFYLGSSPLGTGQNPFQGNFEVAKRWRKNQDNCQALCKDEQDPIACKSKSVDYFKVFNTSCVGFAKGFVGGQIRSVPVAHFGVTPPGWTIDLGGLYPMTPPKLIDTGGFKNEIFSDDSFIRFGGNSKAEPMCPTEAGTLSSCPEKLPFSFRVPRRDFKPTLGADGKYSFGLKVRYRNSFMHTNPTLRGFLTVYNGAEVNTKASIFVTFDLKAAHSDWITIENSIKVNAADLPANSQVELLFHSLEGSLTGTLDLDGIEILDFIASNAANSQMLPLQIGGFYGENIQNPDLGSYASWMIDRLGAVGWWGSSNHHLTGGYAYSNQFLLARSFLSGLTIGESLHLAGNGMTGLAYIDPIYRPIAVSLFATGETDDQSTFSNSDTAFYLITKDTVSKQQLRMNAFIGKNTKNNLKWIVEKCVRSSTNAPCDQFAGNWSMVTQGAGLVFGRDISGDSFKKLISNLGVSEVFEVRLKVWSDLRVNQKYLANIAIKYSPEPELRISGLPNLRGSSWPSSYGSLLALSATPLPSRIRQSTIGGVDTLTFRTENIVGIKESDLSITVFGRSGTSYPVTIKPLDRKNPVWRVAFPAVNKPEVLNISIALRNQSRFDYVAVVFPGNASENTGIFNLDAAIVDEADKLLFEASLTSSTPSPPIRFYDLNLDGALTQQDLDLFNAIVESGQVHLPK
jgi:uncharacterized protein (TIGR03790 family)